MKEFEIQILKIGEEGNSTKTVGSISSEDIRGKKKEKKKVRFSRQFYFITRHDLDKRDD